MNAGLARGTGMAVPLSRRLDFAAIPVVDVGPLVAGGPVGPTRRRPGPRLPLEGRQAVALNARMRGYIPSTTAATRARHAPAPVARKRSGLAPTGR